MKDYPIIKISGAETCESAYEYGQKLEEAFPGQDCMDLAYAVEYNSYWPEAAISKVIMLEQGQKGGTGWVWVVKFEPVGESAYWQLSQGSCVFNQVGLPVGLQLDTPPPTAE